MVLYLLFCCRGCHISFPNDVAAQTGEHINQFGIMEATVPMAPVPTRMLIVTSLEGYHHLVQNPTYSYVDHNPQLTHNVR
jgi:hypothetical protein